MGFLRGVGSVGRGAGTALLPRTLPRHAAHPARAAATYPAAACEQLGAASGASVTRAKVEGCLRRDVPAQVVRHRLTQRRACAHQSEDGTDAWLGLGLG